MFVIKLDACINIYKSERVCLTFDCKNPKDPGRFRGETNKPDQQTCSFKINNNDQLCKIFVRKTVINNETNLGGIHFEIRGVKSRLKKNNETFGAKTELDNLIQNGSGNVRVSKGRGTNSAGDISKRNR